LEGRGEKERQTDRKREERVSIERKITRKKIVVAVLLESKMLARKNLLLLSTLKS
jgi:hypothetical protein